MSLGSIIAIVAGIVSALGIGIYFAINNQNKK